MSAGFVCCELLFKKQDIANDPVIAPAAAQHAIIIRTEFFINYTSCDDFIRCSGKPYNGLPFFDSLFFQFSFLNLFKIFRFLDGSILKTESKKPVSELLNYSVSFLKKSIRM